MAICVYIYAVYLLNVICMSLYYREINTSSKLENFGGLNVQQQSKTNSVIYIVSGMCILI